MKHILDIVVGGTGHWVLALTMMRVALGLFFSISGLHKLLWPERHRQFVETLMACGVPYVWFCQWFVAGVEFFGGIGLVLGLATPVAAVGVLVVCVVATCTDGIRRVAAMHPIDRADRVDDILYLPEVLYIIMLITVVIGGSGPWSLDALIRGSLS